jgi:hypothetical protein
MARPIIITANGNAQIDTAQSKFGGSSAYFDGATDYLVATNDGTLNFSTNNITIETWVRPVNRTNAYPIIACNETTAGWNAGTWVFCDRHDAQPTKFSFWIYNYSSSAPLLVSTTTVANDTWYHLVIVRNGNTWKMYVNGVEEASQSYSGSLDVTGRNILVGVGGTLVNANSYHGWIDEFRISNSARYTANFTPATSAFQSDANTLLLMHMDGTDSSTKFIDDIRSQSFTAGGNVQISTAQSKFGGASIAFDGNQDYMTTPYSAPYWKWNEADYTIEFWGRFIAVSSAGNPLQIGLMDPVGGLNYWSFGIANSGQIRFYYYNGNTTTVNSGVTINGLNVWDHFAFVYTKSNNTIRLFYNGTQVASTTVSGTPQFQDVGATVITIGQYNNNAMNGYLDEIRVSKSARYTSNFTPATSPFVSDADTLLLLHGDGTNGSTTFIDSTETVAIELAEASLIAASSLTMIPGDIDPYYFDAGYIDDGYFVGVQEASASISSTASLSAIISHIEGADIVLAPFASLSADATRSRNVDSNISSIATVDTIAQRIRFADSALSSNATLAGTVEIIEPSGEVVEASGAFDSAVSLTASAERSRSVDSTITSAFTTTAIIGKLQDSVIACEALFTPSLTVEVTKNSTAVLDTTATLESTVSKFTGYESLQEFIAALNAQADKVALFEASLTAEAQSAIDAARTRDTASSLAVSVSVTSAIDGTLEASANVTSTATLTAVATRIQTASASISSSASVVANAKSGVLALKAANLKYTIPNPDIIGTMTDDQWGQSVAQNNSVVVVGMPNEEGSALETNSGRVSVINLSTGSIQYTIQHPVPVNSGAFGRVVAVSNSYFAATSSTNVYVFNLSNGSLRNTYTYESSAGLKTLSLTDSYLAIGSSLSDIGGSTNTGQVGIFNSSTGASVRTINNPNAFGTTTGDTFGSSVKVHGNLVLVAAEGEDDAFSSNTEGFNSGKAYLFDITTGNLLHTFNNPAVSNETAADGFACDIDMNSEYITIGAFQEEPRGVIYVYSATTYALLYTIQTPATNAGQQFGRPLSLSGDYLISRRLSPASAFIYDLNIGTDFITVDDPDYFGDGSGGNFGGTLDISADYAVVGSSTESVSEGGTTRTNAGVVYIFDLVKGLNNLANAVLSSSFNLSVDTTVIKGTSAGLTSAGTLTVEGVKLVDASATLSSAFSQTVLNSRTRDLDTEFESIATQISAVGRVGQGFITLDSVASVSASAEKVAVASSTLESTAELVSSADRTRSDIASLSSEFAFTASIDKFVGFESAQSSTASLEALADKFTGFASAQTSEFAVTADVDKFSGNQIVISSEFAVTAQGERIRFADSAQASEFTVFADTIKSTTAEAALESSAELSATALRIQSGTIQTDSVASQLVAVAKIGDFLITIDTVASLSADASVTSGSIATALSEFDLVADNLRVRFGDSTQNATTALSVSGTLATDSTVAFASQAQLSVSSTRSAALSADLQTTGNLSAISLRILDFSADLEAFNSSLTAIDKFAENQVDMLVESALVASADRSRDNNISATASADLTSSGERVRFNSADLDSAASVEAAISRTKQFEITLSGAMQFESTVVAQKNGEILIQTAASLGASAEIIRGVSVALSSVSAQTTSAQRQRNTGATITSTATVAATVRLFVLLEEYVFVIPRERRSFTIPRETRTSAISKEDREFIIRG